MPSDSMTNPPVEQLLEATSAKFELVTLAATRAREINEYLHQLGGGIGAVIPPQVASTARKPLSVAFEELGADKIVLGVDPNAPEPEPEADAGQDIVDVDVDAATETDDV